MLKRTVVQMNEFDRQTSNVRQVEFRRDSGGGNTGGRPPGGNGVEARVAKLESDIEYIKRDVADLVLTTKLIQGDVNVLKTQSAVLMERTAGIEKNMITKGQLAVYAFLALITVGAGAIGGTIWIVQQYLAPILASLN